jgi:uncharacterized membrane protein YkvA (DUF1232 family)
MALHQLKCWARALKLDVIALWLAARDDRTPPFAKIVAASVAALALSPIDLIPDFIPILGYLDDLIIVPLGIALAIRLIPPALMADFRSRAALIVQRPESGIVMTLIIMLWLCLSLPIAIWTWRHFN